MKLVINFLLSSIIAFALILIMPGLTADYWTAALTSMVLGLINISIKPLLALLSIIPTFITIIISLFFMNGVTIVLTNWILDGFIAEKFWSVAVFSAILAVINWGIHRFIWKQPTK